MQIVSYNKQELANLISSDFYSQLRRIPISYHRAISQINNPYCDADDIILIAAYDQNELTGYVGLLPDTINIHQTEEKIYWLSCFWVANEYRNSVLASQLFFGIVKKYKTKIFISNFLFSLEKTYQSLGVFKTTEFKSGYSFYINLNFSELIVAKFPQFRRVMPVYKTIELTFNKLLRLKQLFVTPKHSTSVFKPTDKITDDISEFLQSPHTSEFVMRNKKHFDWILNFPWIETDLNPVEVERYYFSSSAKKFRYQILFSSCKNKVNGFILLKIRDKTLHVAYAYIQDSLAADAAKAIIDIAKREKPDSIICYHSQICSELSNRKSLFIIRKKISQAYILPKTFISDNNVFQTGDGDAVFT